MQEDIERRSIALTISGAKLTGRVLARCLMIAAGLIQKEMRKRKTPKGKQSLEKLMNHGGPTSTMPLDSDTKLFDSVAREYHVDYTLHQTGPKQYLLCFKNAQADVMTACFSEYSKRLTEREANKQQSIEKQLKQYEDVAKRATPQRERERVREAVRDDR